MIEDKEIYSTRELPCHGRKAESVCSGAEIRYVSTLVKPATPFITTFRDATTEVLCPHFLAGKGCGAAEPDVLNTTGEGESAKPTYPPCAYLVPEKPARGLVDHVRRFLRKWSV
jgi:hypothetical protein